MIILFLQRLSLEGSVNENVNCEKFVLFTDVAFCIELIIIIIIIIIIMLLNKRFSYMYMSDKFIWNNENVRDISEVKNAIHTLIRARTRTRNYSLEKTCLNIRLH